MSTWLAGRKTLTPMSTSKPPLILRVTVPVTMSSFVDGLHDLQPRLDLFGLALAQQRSCPPLGAAMLPSSISSISTLTVLTRLRRGFVLFPLDSGMIPSLL